jgi:hemolysin III
MNRRDRINAECARAKPRLRGWQHAVAAPAAGLATLILTLLAPPGLQLALAAFAVTTILLFVVSAVYHRGSFSQPVTAFLQRWDHANIFLVIAGSATPFIVALLDGRSTAVMLAVMWAGAFGGALIRMLWVHAPRWMFVPQYLALGWVTAMFVPHFLGSHAVGAVVLAWVLGLVVTGGVLYTLGAAVFATMWPNPSPRWFGFHEVFHSFTLGGWLSHFVAAALVVGAVR